MKLFLTIVALAAFAHGAPTTTHTMEIGTNGISGSIQNVPLVEIIVNKITNGEPVVPETVNEPVFDVQPVLVVDEAQNPVIVVDKPEINPIDIISVNPAPAPVVIDQPGVNPVDIIAVNPAPAPVVIDQPGASPVDIIAVNPAPAPVVVDQPGVNPVDIIAVNPAPAPVVVDQPGVNPVDIISVNPAPAPIVVPEPTPAEVIVAPEAAEAGEGNQIINVMLNFIFGASGSLSSVEVPANVIPQVIGAARV